MFTRSDLRDWLVDALKANENQGTIIEVCKYVWENHEEQLKSSGDLFYTWQYDIRWAATQLRQEGIMKSSVLSPKGLWELNI